MIAVTQPRRVAATSIARRVAWEQGTSIGQLVGYSVRFEECTSSSTKIKFATDGMLVRELLFDPQLEKYSVVIVDEAHERTLRTDMILGSLKRILRERNGGLRLTKDGRKMQPLKVLIMSATLDAERFADFFDKAPIVRVKVVPHPRTIKHLSDPMEDFVAGAYQTLYQIHMHEDEGDVLVFMPGEPTPSSCALVTQAL
jgi:ATP-dependent RNA helicase DHX33